MISQIKYLVETSPKEKDQLQVRLPGLNDKVVKLECLDKHKDKILRKYEQSIWYLQGIATIQCLWTMDAEGKL